MIYDTVEIERGGCGAVVDGVRDPISRESGEGVLDVIIVCDCDPGGGRVVTVLLLRYPDCIQQLETGYGTDQGQVTTLVSFDGSSIPAWRSVPWTYIEVQYIVITVTERNNIHKEMMTLTRYLIILILHDTW